MEPTGSHLLVFGLGYTGTAIALAAARLGFAVAGTSRTPERVSAPPEIVRVPFDAASDTDCARDASARDGPARPVRRPGADALRCRDRRRAKAVLDRLPVHDRGVWRPGRRLGGRGYAPRAPLRPRHGSGSRRSRPGHASRTAARWTFSGWRASTAPAVRPSTLSAPAPRAGSSSRATSSAVSIATTSRQPYWPPCGRSARRACGFSTSRTTNPRKPRE